MGLETPWGAYQFNEICLMVGRRVENNLNKGKDAFDGLGSSVIGKMKRGYQSAKQFVKKKVKIKNGIW